MAGLLDFLDSAGGQGLLSAAFGGLASARRGAPLNAIGAAGLSGLQGYLGAKQTALQNQMTQAQLEDVANQAALRNAQIDQIKRRLAYMDSFMGGQPQMPQSPMQASQAALTQGAQAGSIGPTVANAQRMQSLSNTQPQSADASGMVNGVPLQAILADFALNDGKNVGEWMFKQGVPDMQVSNGYAYDKNRVQPGFLPQFNVAQNGMASLTTIGPDGLPRVSAPTGAVNTYSQFRNADEAAKAGYDLTTVTPPRGQPRLKTKLQAVQEVNGQPARGPNSDPTFVDVQGNPSAFRSQLVAHNVPQSVIDAFDAQYGNKAPGIEVQSPAQADYDAARAKDLSQRASDIYKAGESAPTKIAQFQQIGQLLDGFNGSKYSPTGVEISKAAASFGLPIDPKVGNKEAAMSLSRQMALELRNPAGGAGMPGAMSDEDRAYLSSMAPGIENTAQGRQQIINARIAVEQRNQQVAQAARNYEAKYGRLDNGFLTQLSQWANAHPLFGKK